MYSVQSPAYLTELDARFAAAARHSAFVRALRVAVPVAVVLAMGAIVGISIFNPFRALAKLPVEMDGLVVSGTKITMEAPRMSGFTADKRPYDVWAKTAVQDLTDPANVALTVPKAKILAEDGSTVTIDARTGRFNNKTQMLELHQDVYLQTSAGYDVRLNHALIDLGAGAVSTDDGVNVKFAGGRVSAKRLRLTEKGDVVRFEGNVMMELDSVPAAEPRAASATEPSQAPMVSPDAASGAAPVSAAPVSAPAAAPGKPRSLSGNRVSAK